MERHFTEEGIQMAEKPMKRCSKSLVIRKCQLKPQRNACMHLSKRLKEKIMITPNAGEAVGRLDHSHTHCCGNYKTAQMLCKTVWLKEEGATEKWACHGGGGTRLCVGCPSAQVLAVVVPYSFTRCHNWGKWGKGHMGSLGIISYNCMWICNYLKIKFNLKISLSLKCQGMVLFK